MSQEKDKTFKKKLTVTDCTELVSWPNPKGTTETVLYEVKAVDGEGQPWEPRPLRSFALLEIGIEFEYEVSPYKHPKTGEESITVKRPRQNTTQRVQYLEEQMENVLDRLAGVEAQLTDQSIRVGAQRPLGDPIPGQQAPGLGGRVG